jgi:hypothetical protein
MRSLRLILLLAVGVWQCWAAALGAEFEMTNGDIVRGEPVSFNDDGMVVRLEVGGFSPRISWSKLTQASLQSLSKNPQAAKFVEPFIDVPPVPKEKEKKKKDIILKPVPRVERIEKPNFFASIATPAGLVIFLVLFLANLYAAYEIALFRHRSVPLVLGLSLFFPVLAPALFLAMPGAAAPEAEPTAQPETAAAPAASKTTGPLAKAPMASGLSISHEKAGTAAPAAQGPQTFKRGEFTFNRRFVETKFPNFFRVVQSEDVALVVRSAKEEYVAKRISRISTNEMHLQLVKGGEVSIPFAEITEMQVRAHAKA